jgi:uncharacterized phage infection (PIP) family protein YhgE
VQSDTDDTINKGAKDLKKSKGYANNFSTVLSNTRASGADQSGIYSFFANPLSINDTTPSAKQVQAGFDWRWVLMFVIGLLVGVSGYWIARKASLRRHSSVF